MYTSFFLLNAMHSMAHNATAYDKNPSSPEVGIRECAGINRHVVGDERALQERRVANPSWPRVLQATSRGVG